MNKLLILNGHPSKNSLSRELCETIVAGVGKSAKLFHVSEMDFSHDLEKDMPVEPDIKRFQDALKWCDTLVIAHPLWWGGPPAKLKALFDRSLLPDFAYRYEGNKPVGLLKGKTPHLLLTSDSPAWYLKWILGNGWVKILNRQILGFVGFSKLKTTNIGPVRTMNATARQAVLEKVKAMYNT